jgi:glycosyltransferase involved in cell wall biosynthesis
MSSSAPLRVLHVYKTWSPESLGGVGEMITALSEAGKAEGIVSRVLYLGHTDTPRLVKYKGLQGICLPLDFEVRSMGGSWRLPRALRKLGRWCDLLHFHFPWPFGDLAFLLSGLQKPYIVTYHSDIVKQKWLKRFYDPLGRVFLKKARCVVATSPPYIRTSPLLQKNLFPVDMVPLALPDVSTIPISPQREAYWREKVGENFLFFLGALRYYKGLHVLLEAASFVQGLIVIAGSGGCEPELRQMAREKNLSNVVFVGSVTEEDKAILHQLSSGFVFPSHLRSEAFGLSLVEASLWGKPMISCEIGTGTSYINLHEKTGLVVPPSDPQALAQALNVFLREEDRRRTWGENARARYLELFQISQFAKAYKTIYEKALEN